MTMTSPVEADSGAWAARRLLERYIAETEVDAAHSYLGVRPEDYPAGREILAAEPAAQIVIRQAALATLAPWRTAAVRMVTHLPGVQAGLARLGETAARLHVVPE